MLSDEEKEIFKNLKEYMQNNINNGYHKFIYNDLDWDFKCIDCINAIDKVLNQSKEIERINAILVWKQKYEEQLQKEIEELKKYEEGYKLLSYSLNNYISKDKIKAKIEEQDKIINTGGIDFNTKSYARCKKEVLQSLLEKE